ncbi:MAG: DeoR/GlpR transcriptional regulator [Rhodobacteraceae bacterium]|nr:DeoR/GlpR transcriptional regulator [Paracoccaceae bacterium]
MQQNFRLPDILEIARIEGKVTVDDLAERFQVTVQTIRRDLGDLANSGRLERVHGGAILSSGNINIGYQDRRSLNETAKHSIAKACAARIPNGASVFLNIGTSTEAVASALLDHQNLLVVTNNMNVAHILASRDTCQVIITGGSLRRSDGGLVGHLASSTIRQFKFDFAVIGCSALDLDGDLLDFDFQEVDVSQTIIKQARKTLLVADHSKLHRTAPARIGSLSEIDTMYTDQPLPTPLMDKCQDWKTEIVARGL